MNTHRKLWKVELTHKMGAHAPSYFVETEYGIVKSKSTKDNKEVEKLQALKKAKTKTRLSDFPNSWNIDVIHQENMFWDSKKQNWMKM